MLNLVEMAERSRHPDGDVVQFTSIADVSLIVVSDVFIEAI